MTSYGQYVISIDGKLIDEDTQEAISFVNIGFIEKGIGTVSGQDGKFTLIFEEQAIDKNDHIQFSVVGYESKKFTLKELAQSFEDDNMVYLKQKIEGLDEVHLTSNWEKKETYGYSKITKKFIGYWKDKAALGGEIATLIKLKHGKQKLSNLKFQIVENTADSIKVRVNVYDYKKKSPANNLLYDQIYSTLSSSQGQVTIELDAYNIVVEDDIVVSLELVEVYGESIEFAVAGAFEEATSFLKYISQDKWIPSYNTGLAFSVDTRHLQNNSNLLRGDEPINNVVVYWDSSWSMRDRNIDAEIDVLLSYLEKIDAKKLKVITFSNTIKTTKDFNVATDTQEIDRFLRNQKPLGASVFKKLDFQVKDTDAYLLFSDGEETLGNIATVYANAIVHALSSEDNVNSKLLRELSDTNDGRYVNLSQLNTKKALEMLIAPEGEVFSNLPFNEENAFKISGTVTFKGNVLQGCYVSLNDSFREVQTDNNGNYTIYAKNGDILNYRFINMLPKQVVVDGNPEIDVELESEYESLDEILLTGTTKKREEIKTLKEQRERNKKVSGSARYSLDSEDFLKSAIYLSDVIRGRIPGVVVQGLGINATFKIRGRSSISNTNEALFIVDGIQYAQAPNFIDVNTIANISVEPGLAAAPKYGQGAQNGVIIITTKIAQNNSKLNSLLATNNDYDEILPVFNYGSNLDNIANSFDGKSPEEAYDVFTRIIAENPLNLNGYLEYYNHIKGNVILEQEVLSTIAEVAGGNARVLRSLSFYLERDGFYDLALEIGKEIARIEPGNAQSQINLAQNLVQTGNYQSAFIQYKSLLANSYEDFKLDDEALLMLENEMKRLLTHHRDKVSFEDAPSFLLQVMKPIEVRYVVSWNDPQMEFDLQFVNPNDKFYTWNHTLEYSDGNFKEDIENGLMTEEFILDGDTTKGKWLVNINNKSLQDTSLPSFIKIEKFKNYGGSNETREISIVPFNQLDRKYTIESVDLAQTQK